MEGIEFLVRIIPEAMFDCIASQCGTQIRQYNKSQWSPERYQSSRGDYLGHLMLMNMAKASQ